MVNNKQQTVSQLMSRASRENAFDNVHNIMRNNKIIQIFRLTSAQNERGSLVFFKRTIKKN